MHDVDTMRAAFCDTFRAFKEADPSAAASFLKDRPDLTKYVRDPRGKLLGWYFVQTGRQVASRVDVYDQNGTWVGYQGDVCLGEVCREATLTNETFSPCGC